MSNTQIKAQKEKQLRNDALNEHVISSNEKTTITLEAGKNSTTLSPGKLIPIMYKEVLAGEYIKEWNITNLTRLITPLVPTLDRLYLNISAHFVPFTAVWEEAEKIIAATGTSTNAQINLPKMTLTADQMKYSTFARMAASRYGLPNKAGETEINVLLLRGYRKIVNDFIINKDYENKKIEYKDTTPTTAEKNAIIGYQNNSTNLISGQTDTTILKIENAPSRKNYLNNIKKYQQLGQRSFDEGDEGNSLQGATQSTIINWLANFKDAKQRADNRNKNEWDIIAEMGGTIPVRYNQVEFLGDIDYELNFQQITQSAPEINSSSPLGTTGSFSFTKANGTLFQHRQFKQHGFIHILANVQIDNIHEKATPKEILKTNVFDLYRPGMAEKEIQLLGGKEISNSMSSNAGVAYQPPYAEYKRLPSFASGQMQTETLIQVSGDQEYTPVSNSQWHNMKAINSTPVIDGAYFRDTLNVAKVIERNNILNIQVKGDTFPVEPIINMSEHIVTTSLPIVRKAIKQNDSAEKGIT